MEFSSSNFGLNPSSTNEICSLIIKTLTSYPERSNSFGQNKNYSPLIYQQNKDLLANLQSIILQAAQNDPITKTSSTTNLENPIITGETKHETLPLGLETFKYESISNKNPHLIIPPATNQPYILAAIGTPPLAGELYLSRTANLFNDAWKQEVKNAIEKNGGLGTESDGYLAFSKIGFVRLNNPNLSKEQNRQLAAIS